MHKNSPFLYYLALFILALAVFKHYNQNKLKPKNEVVKAGETKSLTIDLENINQSVNDAKSIIGDLKGTKKRMNSFTSKGAGVSYIKNEDFANRVNLCFSPYKMHLRLFSEDGEKLYDKENFTLNEVKDYTDFYSFLESSLVLTSHDEILEIFIPKIELLPPSFTEKENDKTKSALIKLLFIKSDGKNSLFINDIIVNSSIILKDGKRRENPQFLCGDKIKLTYKIYDANQNEVASEEKSLTLNGEGAEFEKILQYMVLASKSKNLDGTLPSYKYSQAIKDQTLTIKGIIELNND